MQSRRSLLNAVAALAGVVAVAAAAAAPAWAADRRVTILNKTGYTMVEFYASAANERSWEEDILGADTLPHNSSVQIDIDDGSSACVYDFKAVFDDGDELMRDGIDVCTIETYTYR